MNFFFSATNFSVPIQFDIDSYMHSLNSLWFWFGGIVGEGEFSVMGNSHFCLLEIELVWLF